MVVKRIELGNVTTAVNLRVFALASSCPIAFVLTQGRQNCGAVPG